MLGALTQVLTVTLKELRELLRRPLLVLTMILGPLAIMVAFGIGSETTFPPPKVIVVVPPGQEKPRLLQDYQRQFEQAVSKSGVFVRHGLHPKAEDCSGVTELGPDEGLARSPFSGIPTQPSLLFLRIC